MARGARAGFTNRPSSGQTACSRDPTPAWKTQRRNKVSHLPNAKYAKTYKLVKLVFEFEQEPRLAKGFVVHNGLHNLGAMHECALVAVPLQCVLETMVHNGAVAQVP